MDKFTELFFEKDRWTQAIAKGVMKDIRKDELYRLTKPETRLAIYNLIREGKYRISPPHAAKIPKDTPGEFRTVYVNEPVDRVLLSIANDLLFETCRDMIHPACRSYLKGTGCSHVVQDISREACKPTGASKEIGWKADLSKYFDSVPLRYIDDIFDKVETRVGKSDIISVIRDYYHCNLFFDEDNILREKYQSLKQGCSVAAFLADTILYHIDEKLSSLVGMYVRYSDDMLFLQGENGKAMNILRTELARMDMTLNPRKVETLYSDKWFKFLGFSIRGKDISLSSTRIKTFQKEIQTATFKGMNRNYGKAVTRVNRFLYRGDGEHSWATQVLTVCNVQKDINILNGFVMDALRATVTGKTEIGGLGYIKGGRDGCIMRGKGKNVRANKEKTGKRLEGYLSLGCMRNALLSGKSVYRTLITTIA